MFENERIEINWLTYITAIVVFKQNFWRRDTLEWYIFWKVVPATRMSGGGKFFLSTLNFPTHIFFWMKSNTDRTTKINFFYHSCLINFNIGCTQNIHNFARFFCSMKSREKRKKWNLFRPQFSRAWKYSIVSWFRNNYVNEKWCNLYEVVVSISLMGFFPRYIFFCGIYDLS